jgi:hypothetical protein
MAGIGLAALLSTPIAAQDVDWDKAIIDYGREIRAAPQLPAAVTDIYKPEPELTLAQHAMYLTLATIYDAESTFYVLGERPELSESNPAMRPFVENGRLSVYAVQGLANYYIIKRASRLQREGNPLWDMQMRLLSELHVFAGTSNISHVK